MYLCTGAPMMLVNVHCASSLVIFSTGILLDDQCAWALVYSSTFQCTGDQLWCTGVLHCGPAGQLGFAWGERWPSLRTIQHCHSPRTSTHLSDAIVSHFFWQKIFKCYCQNHPKLPHFLDIEASPTHSVWRNCFWLLITEKTKTT